MNRYVGTMLILLLTAMSACDSGGGGSEQNNTDLDTGGSDASDGSMDVADTEQPQDTGTNTEDTADATDTADAGNDTEPDSTNPPEDGHVRFFLATTAGVQNMCADGTLSGGPLSGDSRSGYGAVSGYKSFIGGQSYDFWTTIPPQDCSRGTVSSRSIVSKQIEAGSAYTFVAPGSSSIGPDFFVLEHEMSAPSAGKAGARVVNVLRNRPELDGVDLCNPVTGAALAEDSAPYERLDYQELDPGELSAVALHQPADQACQGERIGVAPVSMSAGGQYSLFILHRGPDDPPSLSVCQDSRDGELGTSTCIEYEFGPIPELEADQRCSADNWCWEWNPIEAPRIVTGGDLSGPDPEHLFTVHNGRVHRFDGDVWLNLGPRYDEVDHVQALGANEAVAMSGEAFFHYKAGTWRKIPAPLGVDGLRQMWAPSSSEIWAVGDEGVIVHYDGNSTDLIPSGTTERLHAVTGDGTGTLYAAGSGEVLRFDGTSWSSFGTLSSTRPVHELVAKEGYLIARATDAWYLRRNGQWEEQTGEPPAAIEVYNGDLYLLFSDFSSTSSGRDNRLEHRDGSQTTVLWERDGTNVEALTQLWVGGVDGPYVMAGDETWRFANGELERFVPTVDFEVAWCDATRTVLASADGYLLYRDAGPWRRIVTAGDSLAEDKYFGVGGDAQGLLAVSSRPLSPAFLHTYSGTSWLSPTEVSLGNGANPSGAVLRSSAEAYIAGRVGTTSNQTGFVNRYNGTDWQSIYSDQGPSSLRDIESIGGLSSGELIVSGTNQDGSVGTAVYDGTTWQALAETRSADSLWGTSPNDVWALDAGRVYHFNGTQWAEHTFSVDINSLHGAATDDVYAVGNQGKLFHYDGTGWQEEATGTSRDLLGIQSCEGGAWLVHATNGALLRRN